MLILEMFIFNIFIFSFMLVSMLRLHVMVSLRVPWQDICYWFCVIHSVHTLSSRRECLALPLQVLVNTFLLKSLRQSITLGCAAAGYQVKLWWQR